MNYEKELKILRELKSKVLDIDLLILFLFCVFIIGYFIIPDISVFFGLAIWVVIYRRVLKIAHFPCPKCNQPFGNKSKLVLSVTTPPLKIFSKKQKK